MDSDAQRKLIRAFLKEMLPEDLVTQHSHLAEAEGEADEVGRDAPKRSIEFPPTSESAARGGIAKPPVARKERAASSAGRFGGWLILCLALACAAASVWGFEKHREKWALLSKEHLRLFITGPSVIQEGLTTELTILVTTMEGRAVAAEVDAVLSGTASQPLKKFHLRCDPHGRVRLTIAADVPLPPKIHLAISAWPPNGGVQETAETSMLVVPVQWESRITLDKTFYRPGETLRIRSLTLSQFALTSCGDRPIQFAVCNATGAAVPKLLCKTSTKDGVAGGELVLPTDLADGNYCVTLTSDDGVITPEKCAFKVRRGDLPTAKTVSKPANSSKGRTVNVRFFPEGGHLAANVENRVYFFARTSDGRPVSIIGQLVGQSGGDRLRYVTAVQTTCDGMGEFSFVPHVGTVYRLKISEPAEIGNEPPLLDVIEDDGVSINVGAGVFGPASPVRFVIRTSKAGMPLIAAAYCRGVQVAEQTIETKGSETAENSAELHLDDSVAGVVRLVVYDYSASPPKVVAERLVYRQPGQRLEIQSDIVNKKTPSDPSRRLSVVVKDEGGEPTPAVLSVAATTNAMAGGVFSDAAFFYLNAELVSDSQLENADFYLSKQRRGRTPAAAVLDLLLGVQERGRQPCCPPLVYDNLRLLRVNFEQSLAAYRSDRSPPLNTISVISFYGGLGLLVLTAMALLLRTASAMAWIPSVVAAVLCTSIGTVLMMPDRQNANAGPASFFSYRADAVSAKNDGATPSQSGPAEKPQSLQSSAGETLLWRPVMATDAEGHATIVVESSASPATVVIDAHSPGRFGFTRIVVPAAEK